MSNAAAAVAAPAVSTAGSLAQMTFSLLLVLGLIFALAWVLRRVQGVRPGGAANLKVNAGIQVGAKERVLMVQAGEVHLLIGVAPGQVNVLHRFEQAPQFGNTQPQMPAFAEALKRALGGKSGE